MRGEVGQIFASHNDAALIGCFEARDHPQGGRLAATRGPEQGEEFARHDTQIDPVNHPGLAVEAFLDPLQTNVGARTLDHLRRERHPLRMRVTRASTSSLRSLYHFQSTWMSCATLASVL